MPPTLLRDKPDTEPSAETDKTAVLYLRVSTSGQVNKAHDPLGYSIPGQRQACERYAASLGARVVREYTEPGRSATNTQRKALQQLLGDLPELQPTYVVFYDLSRVARDEPDAFWLLGEINRCGSQLVSTREPVDNSPQGLLLFAIMAGVNAFRSRDDGTKVKMGLERKFAEGGTHGLAPVGYLNVRENVNGREVASIAVDPERAPYITLAFDLAKTGEHSITSIVEILVDAGLRSRPTLKRPARPLSRSMVHRVLRDDYYTGVVTRKGIKRPGLHPALVDEETFAHVQTVLDAHRLGGDRTHKHHHYLKGTIYCACGKRFGYGRHRGKCGGIYEYFSCLSRVQRGERCVAPYFPVEPTERAIVRRYKHETLTAAQRESVRAHLLAHVEVKSQVARRESGRHKRRLRELTGQQQKLVQLYYDGGVSKEVLQAEQQRIEEERAQAKQWADAAAREVEDVMQALDDALVLLDARRIIYEELNQTCRRLANQAVFTRLVLIDPDTVVAERTPVYEAIAQVVAADAAARAGTRRKRARAGATRPASKENPDPESQGRGSYVVAMAGATGVGDSFGTLLRSGNRATVRSAPPQRRDVAYVGQNLRRPAECSSVVGRQHHVPTESPPRQGRSEGVGSGSSSGCTA